MLKENIKLSSTPLPHRKKKKKKKKPSEQGIQHFPQKGIQTTFSQRKVSAIDTITIQFSDETTICN
jgi:hypothetical protein